jgi:hypothetical protein
VLADWVIHGAHGQQFDAIALIREFRIRSAEPALHELAAQLADVPGPVARNLGEKVQSVLEAQKSAD